MLRTRLTTLPFLLLALSPFVMSASDYPLISCPLCKSKTLWNIFSSPEHEVLMVSYCGQSMSVVRRAASTIALKAYSSYTPGPIDLILGRKHQGDL